MSEITFTEEQEAVISAAKRSKSNLLISALAGAAKTTTLVAAAHAMPLVPTFCGAFNKRIAEEMARRMPSHIQCATMNSIGHRVWATTIGKRPVINTDKGYETLSTLVEKLRPEERKAAGEGFASMLRAVRTAKSAGYIPEKFKTFGTSLITEDEFQEAITAGSDVEPDDQFFHLVDQALELSISDAFGGKIDFDDQIYMSTLFGGAYPKFPCLMVDEAQDLSPLNHKTLERMYGGRLIAVGDPNQAIYAFRGAHSDSMNWLREKFSMETLPLNISFRCPKSVVARAQRRIPHMASPDWAIEGEVRHVEDWNASDVPDGAAVICRNNAPLFKTAMNFIKAKRGIKIVGGDIGASLVKLLRKMGKDNTPQEDVLRNIEAWRTEELSKASSSRHGPIHDRAECMIVFVEQGPNLGAAVAYAELLFRSTGSIQFLTGHKAKGMEYEVVYYLDAFLIPSKWSQVAAENGDERALQQEHNLDYVISTRTKDKLYFVNSEELQWAS